MNEKHHDYLLLFAAAILVIAVFAGVFLNKMPTGSSTLAGISGSFALGTCDELNNLFVQNKCNTDSYDGYTCMKIAEARIQMACQF